MDRRQKKPSSILSEYFRLLGVFSFILMFLTVVEAVYVSRRYVSLAIRIEGITTRELSPGWTITLLCIPLTVQLLVLVFLTFHSRKRKGDASVRHYFKFYFIRTFFSSFLYVSFWVGYTWIIDSTDPKGTTYFLRWSSLIAIILLVGVVVHATYLTTRSSFRNARRLFTAEDI